MIDETVTMSDIQIEEEVDIQLDKLINKQRELILFDDDYHTFDFVIDSLVSVCEHSMIQAEQCTYIVHYKGKCAVKRGAYNSLTSFCNALKNRGLTAEIH